MERGEMRVAGVGFNSAATPEGITAALRAAEAITGPVAVLATIRHKADQLAHLASALGLPVSGHDVAGVATPSQSDRVQALFGTGSVAEAAALVAAGPGARLIMGRVAQGGVSVAVAEGKTQ
ncbi:cobalamin biosynthesis protein [Sinirhodobacter sp. WL0062]|uniref:Cobalamin biosynthesis protein n=1 Tax=Rhodobacter flavimaris TaxID=2907145 RepID=A0ABS8YYZ9_9RHOB|nr:cobalamin biosynthesis protein [Sinirhodobacter sp. WL0062]MCE5975024.1 cobalamin biosynthesis protein [Sinirhodobacter sp. WL0062]